MILAVETSTELGSVALIDGANVLGQKTWRRGTSHSEFVTPAVSELVAGHNLKLSDITQFAVGTGPGSFTGIRVAVNFVRAAAYALKRQVFCLDSLRLLAHQNSLQTFVGTIAVVQFGFRDIFYVARYDLDHGRSSVLLPPLALEAKALRDCIHPGDRVIGGGAEVLRTHFHGEWLDRLVVKEANSREPEAQFFAPYLHRTLVDPPNVSEWSQVIPLYIRASEAEERLKTSN